MVPTGKGKKTFKSQTQSGMRVDDLYIPLKTGPKGQYIDWKQIDALRTEPSFPKHIQAARDMGIRLFVKRAKVGMSKHIRVRPMFEQWGLEFTISAWDDELTEAVLKNIYTYAGTYKGLGDWRPGSPTPGSYGMFKLDSLTVL